MHPCQPCLFRAAQKGPPPPWEPIVLAPRTLHHVRAPTVSLVDEAMLLRSPVPVFPETGTVCQIAAAKLTMYSTTCHVHLTGPNNADSQPASCCGAWVLAGWVTSLPTRSSTTYRVQQRLNTSGFGVDPKVMPIQQCDDARIYRCKAEAPRRGRALSPAVVACSGALTWPARCRKSVPGAVEPRRRRLHPRLVVPRQLYQQRPPLQLGPSDELAPKRRPPWSRRHRRGPAHELVFENPPSVKSITFKFF